MNGSVDLWSWRLQGGDARLLSADEVARAARFTYERDRARYVAGRVRLREILGGHLGVKPEAVRFRYGPHGKPELDGLCFNLSHTGDLALLAVTADGPVGVDVEAVRPIDLTVARMHFAPAEARTLLDLPCREQTAAFYRCWTRKEAYLKARGTGLATDLESFEVSLLPGEPPCLLRCDKGEADHWRLYDLDVGPGLAAALALRGDGPPATLRWRERAQPQPAHRNTLRK